MLIPKRFGSWARFRELAGLPPQPRGNPKVRKYTPEGLIGTLLQLVKERGERFRMTDFCRWTGMTTAGIYRHFGSWKEFWAAAGLLPPLRMREHKYSGERLVERLQETVRELKRDLTLTDFCRHTGIPPHPIYYYHGSWPKLRERAGLPRSRKPEPHLSDDELMMDLHRVATWYWRWPRPTEYRQRGQYSTVTYHQRYRGNWKKVETRYRNWLYSSFPAINGVVSVAEVEAKSTTALLGLIKGPGEFSRE